MRHYDKLHYITVHFQQSTTKLNIPLKSNNKRIGNFPFRSCFSPNVNQLSCLNSIKIGINILVETRLILLQSMKNNLNGQAPGSVNPNPSSNSHLHPLFILSDQNNRFRLCLGRMKILDTLPSQQRPMNPMSYSKLYQAQTSI